MIKSAIFDLLTFFNLLKKLIACSVEPVRVISGANLIVKAATISPGIAARGVKASPNLSIIKIIKIEPDAKPRAPPNDTSELVKPFLLPPKIFAMAAVGGWIIATPIFPRNSNIKIIQKVGAIPRRLIKTDAKRGPRIRKYFILYLSARKPMMGWLRFAAIKLTDVSTLTRKRDRPNFTVSMGIIPTIKLP